MAVFTSEIPYEVKNISGSFNRIDYVVSLPAGRRGEFEGSLRAREDLATCGFEFNLQPFDQQTATSKASSVNKKLPAAKRQKISRDAADLEQKVRDLEAQVTAEKQTKEEAIANVEGLLARISKLSALEFENQALNEQIDQLEAELFNEHQKYESAEAEKDEYRSETEDLRESEKAMKLEVEKYAGEVEFWKAKWRAACADVASDVAEKQEEVDDLARELSETQDELEELNEQVGELEEEKEEVEKLLRLAEKDLVTL
ncbi:hypothetical protein HDU98_001819 [Podochytrium sp. JEL0797]|nr:hypothetical protein HDU98_001819 [Podochytrium sp. JEL0797]